MARIKSIKRPAAKRIKTRSLNSRSQTKKSISSSVKSKPYSFKLKRSQAISIAVVIVALVVAYYLKGLVVAALVNGKPILRTSIIKELERQGGKQTLDSLITEELVFQDAKKQNVSVSNDELNQEIKKIEDQVKKQGQSFDTLLTSQGMTRDTLKNRIKLQKLVEKMVGKDIAVSDKEVDEYIEKNKDSIPSDSDAQKVKEGVRQQLRQQKLSEKIQTWLSNLQKNAQVFYFVKY